MADTNLVQRLAFAAVAIPSALGLVWYGGWPLTLLVVAIGVLALRELFDISEKGGVRPVRALGYLNAGLWAPGVFLAMPGTGAPVFGARLAPAELALIALLVLLLLTLTATLAVRPPGERPLEAAAVTFLAPLYTAALPATLLVLRHGQHAERSWPGTWLVFFPLVVTWIVDTAAMFGGRAIGGPKLAPTVSPGKTRSGALAGVVGGLVTAALFERFFLAPTGVGLGMPLALGVGAVLSVVGQVGDLAESLFKRQAGVKDSSALIPGHGGVLDRFDSLYFVLPVTTVLLRLGGVL